MNREQRYVLRQDLLAIGGMIALAILFALIASRLVLRLP